MSSIYFCYIPVPKYRPPIKLVSYSCFCISILPAEFCTSSTSKCEYFKNSHLIGANIQGCTFQGETKIGLDYPKVKISGTRLY